MKDSMLKHIELADRFLAPRQKSVYESTIPECIGQCRATGRLAAFKLAWRPGDPQKPHVYWDSDVAKVMEGMAETLLIHDSPELAAELDSLVDLVIGAQQPDGYLNTHFTSVEPERRWKDLANAHELYCAGHLIEAAVAHFEATGSRKFLDAMCRYADLIAATFGRAPGQKRGYPGHEELELALVKLYRATGEKRYLDLAKYFIDERGAEPNYFVEQEGLSPSKLENRQAHKPVREQSEAEGHAVRALYLYCGVVDVAVETGDRELLDVAKRLFDNIAEKRLYLTGGVGSTQRGEAFSYDYALPNDTAYTESCAAIALIFFAKRLLDLTGERKYAEVVERALYNNALSGISLGGTEFFYANPLEVNPTTMELMNTGRIRQKWFGCSCCPTSYCRFLPQLGRFCAEADARKLRIDIPASARISRPEYEVEVAGNYPYPGAIRVETRRGGEFELAIRIPEWCEEHSVRLNGADAGERIADGYWKLERRWLPGDRVELSFAMPPHLVFANPRVPADAGRVAIQMGPVVYCAESADNPGIPLYSLEVPHAPQLSVEPARGLPEGTPAIRFKARCEVTRSDRLYRTTPPEYADCEACAVPFALWQNRGPGDMQVFLRYEI